MTLNDYIDRHVTDIPAFGKKLGYRNPKSFYRVLSGVRGISPEKARLIPTLTKNKVTLNDIYGAA